MAEVSSKTYSRSSRMSLRGLVKLASEGLAHTWPMHNFISNNPLHDLEYLAFEDAVDRGKQLFGGKGYLSNETYRKYYSSGRIQQNDLDAALQKIALDEDVVLGGCSISQLAVLRAHFLRGLSAPAPETIAAAVDHRPDRIILQDLARKLESILKPADLETELNVSVDALRTGLGRKFDLADGLDAIAGTDVTSLINSEMIKWCRIFLDEGHAPWEIPGREKGLYLSWKELAVNASDLGGIPKIGLKIAQLSHSSEDCLLESLDAMEIPENLRQDYLMLHLAAMPGWTAFIKWRAEHHDYAWQDAYPVDLVQYLAVRLWYAREYLEVACRQTIQTAATYTAFSNFITSHPEQVFLRRERRGRGLPPGYADQVDRLSSRGPASDQGPWQTLFAEYAHAIEPQQLKIKSLSAAWRLLVLGSILDVDTKTWLESPVDDLMKVIYWIDSNPESTHGTSWLVALESAYQSELLNKLQDRVGQIDRIDQAASDKESQRPRAQAVFCIDVRSEPFRRNLEKLGNYECFGMAGFFTVFIRYCGFGRHHENDLFPPIVSAKNVVNENPHPSQKQEVSRHQMGLVFIHAAHTLLHDLKENVITPYVMVESIGWFFGIPLFGKTFFPASYKRQVGKLLKRLAPPIGTELTLDKFSREAVEKTIASEQQLKVKNAFLEKFPRHRKSITTDVIEALRVLAMKGDLLEIDPAEVGSLVTGTPFQSSEDLLAFVQILREEYMITTSWASARMERITRTGFTLNEQAFTVRTALSLMGLTRNFARLVLFCAHGSSSDNNPYEAALDCGACGGNPGNPNARVLVALANKRHVREVLKKEGMIIPEDTVFIAGQHDTTTDEVELYDLNDLPSSHLDDIEVLKADLKKAGQHNSQERCRSFPGIVGELSLQKADDEVHARSATWSQVRPEWGLSGNAAMIISRGQLIKGIDLGGRTFLHSYDYRIDPRGQLLEIIMTGPQVVAQWINMAYYFSTTDNEIYGSGNKIYHNVVGRLGIMYGAESDLRIGLPLQSVWDGPLPYHEPMRLFTIIEAPRERIEKIIKRHRVLENHFHKGWVHLVALDENIFYRYTKNRTWQEETLDLKKMKQEL